MSSQLISVAPTGLSFASQQKGGDAAEGAGGQTLAGVFAALLGRARGAEAEGGELAGLPDDLTETPGVAALRDVFETLLPKPALDEMANLDAVAAPAAEEPPAGEPGAVVGELVDLLAALETALDAGGTPDPKLLEKLGKALEAVAALLQAPVALAPPATAEPVSAELPTGEPVIPLHQALAQKLAALAERLAARDAPAAGKLTALAEKLGSIKAALADVLEARPELKAAIDQLVAVKAGAKPAEPPPAFAAAELRLPETPSLSAKNAQPSAAAAPEGGEPVVLDVEEAHPRLVQSANGEPRAAMAIEKRELPSLAGQAPAPIPVSHIADAAATVPTQAHSTLPVVDGSAARAVQAAYTAPSPINLPHMAFEIARQVQQGVSKFQIRLDPPELGRVDVKLDIDAAGQVNAKLTVERAETLDLLQRDQRALERALAQAGLDASKTNLEFSLKQNPFAQQDGKGQQSAGSPFADPRGPVVAEAEQAAATTIYRGTASPGGVNIFV